jgi:hypothetical protein
MSSVFIGTAFVKDDAEAANKQWRQVADQLRPKVPKLAAFMDEVAADAFMNLPKDHRAEATPSIRPNASKARLSGAPMLSASSPTKTPIGAPSARCRSNRTTIP